MKRNGSRLREAKSEKGGQPGTRTTCRAPSARDCQSVGKTLSRLCRARSVSDQSRAQTLAASLSRTVTQAWSNGALGAAWGTSQSAATACCHSLSRDPPSPGSGAARRSSARIAASFARAARRNRCGSFCRERRAARISQASRTRPAAGAATTADSVNGSRGRFSGGTGGTAFGRTGAVEGGVLIENCTGAPELAGGCTGCGLAVTVTVTGSLATVL